MADDHHPPVAHARVEALAESDHVVIVRCADVIHFKIGPVTLDLTAAEFAEVAAVVVCAIERLKRRPVPRPAAPKPH